MDPNTITPVQDADQQHAQGGFRRIVGNLTVEALREYDDGPLTPQQQQQLEDEEQQQPGDDENNQLNVVNNLVVLDPDHPLLEDFQRRFNKLLLKREERVTLEAREAKYELDKAKHDREELGVELYSLQQELAKTQMLMEKEHDKFNETQQNKRQVELALDATRQHYRGNQKLADEGTRKVHDLHQERDNLRLQIFYMANAKDEIRGDIAVIRRATEKADADKGKFEVEKQRQDLLVNRLEEKEAKISEDIALYESQLHNQMKETKAAREALTEAKIETEAIEKEKEQLMRNWSSCLIGMKRRDEAHSQMTQAIRAQRQKFDTNQALITSYKKSIKVEQERNEQLTLTCNQRKSDSKNLEKSLKLNGDKMDLLKQTYNTFQKMLKETELQIASSHSDRQQRLSSLGQLQRDIETVSHEKVRLEDEIFAKLQARLTAEKSAQYSDKLRKEQRDKLRDLERNLAVLENEIAKARLEGVQTRALNEAVQRDIDMVQREIEDRNKIISKSEYEIKQRIILIQRKQSQMDLLNKKIDQMIKSAGGVELGPLEIEEKNLNKEIDDYMLKIMDLEAKWLRDQNELVRLIKEREKKLKDVTGKKQEFTVLTTKKMRIEKNIENQQTAIKALAKNLEHLRLQAEKLNKYIYKESDTKSTLSKQNELAENDFIEELRRAELDTVKLQSKIENTAKEREVLMRDLIETDEKIMVWEKRIQIAKEMKAAVDSETGQGEIKEMKFEIHRMKIRYSELMKQQEKLMHAMEQAVSRRDTIITRGEVAQKNPNVVTYSKVQREMSETQKKIKDVGHETGKLETEIRLLRDQQQQLASLLEDKQKNVQSLHTQIELKDADIEELYRQKNENMDELLMKQSLLKKYDQLKQGKYVLLCKQEEAMDDETTKQLDRLRSLSAIVAKLSEDYPNLQTIIRRVELSIQNRLNQEEVGGAEK